MALIALSAGDLSYSADKQVMKFKATATAADTVAFASVLNGRSIGGVRGANVSDGTTLAYTFTAAGVVTVPAGPSSDVIAIIIDFI